VPHALLHNLAHNKVLHERVVFLTVTVGDVPYVSVDDRVRVEPLGHNCYRIIELCRRHALKFKVLETSFF
jgi:KUP system potassium uptake protein